MPIPNLRDKRMTKEQIIAAYENFGWHKNLLVDWIELDPRTNQVMLKSYEYVADTLPCSNENCRTYQLSFVQFMPSGVMWTCGICRKTYGPLTFKDGRLINPPGQAITVAEAWNILKRTKQIPPVGLAPAGSASGVQIIQ